MTKIGAAHNKDYFLKERDYNMYFPKRSATVVLQGKEIGTIGVLHPEVLEHFQLKNPVSCLELDFESVWQFFKSQ